jgi:hypothetical protein
MTIAHWMALTLTLTCVNGIQGRPRDDRPDGGRISALFSVSISVSLEPHGGRPLAADHTAAT